MVEWQIPDNSGISNALVTVNGATIAFYVSSDTITDSYLLPNTPGTNVIEIIATDNNNLVTSAQSTITVNDDDLTGPVISISYSGDGTTADPGIWLVDIENLESGISKVQILVDGEEYLNQQCNAISFISFDVNVLAIEGVHDIEVNAVNNDNDWTGTGGDQSNNSDTKSKEILFWIDPGDPPVIIIG